MKNLLALSCAFLSSLVSAGAVTETFNFNSLNLNIPDGSASGLANVQTPATTITSLDSVIVSASISGTVDAAPKAFNGDIYAYLRHGTGISILLNRTGKTAANAFGYSDNGFNVTFSDTAANGDIHLYGNTLPPAAGQPLLGTWQPDGRATDPNNVLDTDARPLLLGSFNGLNAQGGWTLFVADVSSGEEHTLNSWSLQLTGVPEPASSGALAIGLALASLRRRRTMIP